jgi:hopanoid biosynthesis associated protein HpnK
MVTMAILNGDDFGLSPGINRGIVEAYREGILTSASLMVVGDAFEEAVAWAHENPGLSLGVHLTLVEGIPVLPPQQIPSLVTAEGRFCGSLGMFLQRWSTGRIRLQEVRRELEAQIEKVLQASIRVDKLDSHMHVHMLPGIFQTVLHAAKWYGIQAIRLPRERIRDRHGDNRLVSVWRRALLTSLSALQARPLARAGLRAPEHFAGLAESGHLTEEKLLHILQALKPGVTEIMVHPGYRDQVLAGWPMSQRYERQRELLALTSPRVKALVQSRQIKLLSYGAMVERGMAPPARSDDAQP